MTLAAHPPEARRPLMRRLAIAWEPYLYSAPAVILIVTVMLVPLVVGHLLRLSRHPASEPVLRRLVGLAHFHELWQDQAFFQALGNTLWWTGASVAFQFVFGLILALLLNVPFTGRGAGAGAGVPALGGAELPRRAELGLAVQPGGRAAAALAVRAWHPQLAGKHPLGPAAWRCGGRLPPTSGGASRSLPSRCWRRCSRSRRDLYEAAAIDGAGPIQRFGSITLPFLAPTIAITVLLRTVWIANFADLIVVMTGGGPADRTQILASYIFTQAFKRLDFGYASAVSLVLLVLLLIYSMLIVALRQTVLNRS